MSKTKSPIGLSEPPEDLLPTAHSSTNTPTTNSATAAQDPHTAEEIDLQLQQTDEEVQHLLRDKNLIDRRLSDAERRQRELNELRKKHYEFRERYEKITEKLQRDIVKVEARAQELDNEREAINIILRNYEQQKQQLESIDEKSWSAENLRDELNRAIAILEEASAICANADAQIHAWQTAHQPTTSPPPMQNASTQANLHAPFGKLLLTGLAYTLPLIVTLILLAILIFIK